MSFHGGFIGVLLAMLFFNRKSNHSFFQTTDFIAPLVPLGLAFGRIGNYINGELWGKITTSPLGLYAPDQSGQWAQRYPTHNFMRLFWRGLFYFLYYGFLVKKIDQLWQHRLYF